jgi:predicted Zn-dependent peptidase
VADQETDTDPAGAEGSEDTVAAQSDLTEAAPAKTKPDPGAMPTVLTAGTMVGRYKIVRRLGAGGMGVVYVAHDPELDRDVALKLVRPEGSGMQSKEAALRLLREARAAAKVRHPNVVAIYDAGRMGEEVFVAMELVEGQRFREWRKKESRTWREIAGVMRGAAEGLAAAHAVGLVHRDFKPDNLMVERGRARVLDFGLARSTFEAIGMTDTVAAGTPAPTADVPLTGLTRTGAILGTPAYMAPEQMQAGTVDARADQFAFGVTLFEAFYGERPFTGENVVELAVKVAKGERTPVDPSKFGIPAPLHALTERTLATEAKDRFASMDEVAAALQALTAERQSSRGWFVAAGVAALALGGAGVWMSKTEPEAAESVVDVDPEQARIDAILAASDLPETLEEPLPNDLYGVTIHRLKNGLTVYISPHRGKPQIEAQIAVRGGSKYEAPEQTGAVGLLGLAMSTGGTGLGPLDVEREAEAMGALRDVAERLPGTTGSDREELWQELNEASARIEASTVRGELQTLQAKLGIREWWTYGGPDAIESMSTFPSHRLEAWARIEADRFQNPSFRDIWGALRRRFDFAADGSMYARAQAARNQKLWPGHPSGRAWQTELQAQADLPIVAAEAFHRAWVHPNNTAIFLAGDVDPLTALPILEAAFGDWAAVELPARPRLEYGDVENDAPETLVGGPEPTLLLTWRAPAASHADRVAFAVLDHVFDTRASGPAEKHLRGPGLALDFRATYEKVGPTGTWSLQGHPAGDAQLATLESAVLNAVGDLVEDRVAQSVFDDVQRIRHVQEQRNAEAADGRTWQLQPAYLAGLPWQTVVADRRALDDVTREQVVAAANKWLAGAPVIVRVEPGPTPDAGVTLPEPPPAADEPGETSAFAQKILGLPATRRDPQFLVEGAHYEVLNASGATVVAAHNPGELFALEVHSAPGHRVPAEACEALSAYLPRDWRGGGDPSGLKAPLRALGASADAYCWDERVLILLRGLDADLESVWERVAEGIAHPEGDRTVLRRNLNSMADTQSRERKATILRALESFAIGDDSITRAITPTQLRRLKLEHVKAAAPYLLDEAVHVAYFGPRSGQEVGTILGVMDKSTAKTTDTAPRDPQTIPRHETPRVFVAYAEDRKEAQVSVRFARAPLSTRERAIGSVYDHIVKKSETPDLVASGFSTWMPSGFWGVQAGGHLGDDASVRGSRFAAYDELPDVVRSIRDKLLAVPSEAVVKEAKHARDEELRAEWVSPREAPARILRWMYVGHESDPRQREWGLLQQIGLNDIEKFIGSLHPIPIVCVVGEKDRIDLEALAELGEVTVMPRSKLFPD